MKWPDMEHYRTALQDPSRAFRDPRLKGCSVESNPRTGIPKGSSGRNAVVYKLSDSAGKIAARVFRNEPPPGRQRRMKIIHEYLCKQKVKCLVDFTYDTEGVVVTDTDEQVRKSFPLQTMDWVDGETLGTWFRNAVARGDTRALARMADAWVELVEELRSNGIAHGDLQHGNVMVRNERCVLVDYDGMYVPTMTSPEDLVAYEAGLPGYQHPDRPGQPLSAEIDNFSAWIILIALKAVADDPDLWHRYPGREDREELLIGEMDILSPATSPLWEELIHQSKDPKVRDWSRMLRDSLYGPFEQIPPFVVDVFDEIRHAVQARDWRTVRTLATGKYASRTFPNDLAAQVNEADRRVGCLDALVAKLKSGGAKEIARAYRPELLDDWADPALLDQARKAAAAVATLDALATAEGSDPTGRALVSAWDAAADALRDVAEGDEYREKVESWRRRIAAAERLAKIVAAGRPDREVAEAWSALESLGGHPDAAPHHAVASLASRRVRTLAALANLPDAQDEAADRSFLSVWATAESLFDGRPELDPFRDRATAVHERIKGVERLASQIALADKGKVSEQAIIDAAEALPQGYVGAHAPRVAVAHRRLGATHALAKALRADPPSDLRLAAAAEALRATGQWPNDPAIAARCERAMRRTALIQNLAAIPSTLPLDVQDDRWLETWDETLLAGCRDADPQRARYAQAAGRAAAFEALERAIQEGDPLKVKRLSEDPGLAGHPGLERRRSELAPLIATGAKLDRLLNAAREDRPDAFFSEADAAFIASHRATFEPFRERIDAWVDARLSSGDVLRQAAPAFLPAANGTSVTARWAWGQPQLVRICLVAADPSRFLDRPEEARGGTLRLDPESHRRSQSGAALAIPPGCRRLHVTVWPTVDLGWSIRTGPPLKVGVLDVGPRKKGKA
ncbi:MAG: hypothetical protein AB7I30_16040, partial [Isosphaeraceae bacterium]